MTKIKKSLAVLLALCMIAGFIPFNASAVHTESGLMPEANLGDGTKTSTVITSIMHRFDEDTGKWVPTTRAKPGEHLKIRMFFEADFYVGFFDGVFAYNKNFFTDNWRDDVNIYPPAMNPDPNSFASQFFSQQDSDHINWRNPGGSSLWRNYHTHIDYFVDEHGEVSREFDDDMGMWMPIETDYPVTYIDDETYDNYNWIATVITPPPGGHCNALPVVDDENDWIFELDIIVREDAETTSGDWVLLKDVSFSKTQYGGDYDAIVRCGMTKGDDPSVWSADGWLPYDIEYGRPQLTADPAIITTQSNIILDANGGTITAEGAPTSTEISGTIGTAADVSAVEATNSNGFALYGWGATEDARQADAITAPEYDYEDQTLFAIWDYYTNTYSANGGTFADSTVAKSADQAPGSALDCGEAPSKDGYVFAGWSTDPDATEPDATTTPEADTTYYAVYTAAAGTPYTVNTYTMGVDGTYGAPVTTTEYGTTNATADATPATVADGFYLDTENAAYNATGTILVDGSLALNIYIARNQYDVTFAADGGYFDGDTTATADIVTPMYYGADITAPEIAKTGYSLLGWAAEADATETLEDLGTVPVDGATFYAAWQIDTHNAYFKIGDETYETVPTEYNAAVEYPAAPTADDLPAGKYFIAWDTIDAVMGTDDITITAILGDIEYSIKSYKINDEYAQELADDYVAYYNDVIEEADLSDVDDRIGYTFVEWVDADNNAYDFPVTVTGNLEFYATYAANEYSAFFFTDESCDVEHDLIAADYDSVIPAPETNPTKEGYAFDGWYDLDTAEEVTFDENGPIMGEDAFFYAGWTANTYNAVFYANDATYETIPTAFDAAITAPATAPTKEGYTFLGWAAADGATEALADLGTMDDVNGKEFYAVWDVNTYKVTWVVDGAETEETYAFGAAINEPTDPEKTGHTFAGWTPEVAETMPANDVIYTATWDVNSYTVTWDVDGTTTDATYAYGATINEPDDPEKIGYTFAGWEPEVAATMPANNVTYTATWTANTYTVTWDVDGTTTDATYAYGATINEPDDPEKTGYTFAGWTPEVAATMPASNVTYTATWTANTYNAVFYANDATYETIPTAFDAAITAPATAPEKAGYTFLGWDDDEAATAALADLGTMDDVNGKAFYAVWVADTGTPYTVNVYTMNTAGAYELTSSTQRTGVTDANADITAEAVAADGFYVDADESTLAGPITADGALVLDIYYGRYTYDVTFAADGGYFNGDETATADVTDAMYYGAAITAPTVAKTGYTFAGWTPAVDETVPVDGATYTATWNVNTYTVTWVVDGAETDETYAYGATINEPDDPEKIGYTFAGWEPEVAATMPANNVTYTATWDVNTYTVTWDVDGTTTDATYAYGATINEPATPEKTGYTFAGWTPEVAETMPASNVTYTATWTANTYNAVFYANDATYETIPTAFDAAITAPATAPEKAGYIFLGWDDDEAATTALADFGTMDDVNGKAFYAVWAPDTATAYTVNVYTMDTTGAYGEAASATAYGTTGDIADATPATVAEGFYLDTENAGYQATGEILADGSLVLNIYIGRSTYDVTYDGDFYATTAYYGAAVPAPESTPTQIGFTFTGWTPEAPETMPAADVAFTSTWEQNEYTITYMVDGTQYSVETYHYSDAIEIAAEPTKTGHTFAGWDTELPATMPAENIVVNGSFTVNQYTVTFVADGGYFNGNTAETADITITADYGTALTAPTVAKDGYNFAAWSPSVPATIPAENATYTAIWSSGTSSYTISIYTMNAAGNYGAPVTTTVYGTTGAYISMNPGVTEGFTFDSALSTTSGYVAADNSLALSIYFARNQYDVTFDGVTTPMYYEAALTAPEAAEVPGSVFIGWTDVEGSTTIVDVPTTVPANDLTFYPVYDASTFNINYYVDGVLEVSRPHAYGDAITIDAEPTKVGYTFSGWDVTLPETMPAEDINVYGTFTINSHEVRYLDKNGDVFESFTVTYGEAIPAAVGTPEAENFTFVGWEEAVATMPDYDVEINPIFDRVPVKLIAREGSTTVIDRENGIIYGLCDKLTLVKLNEIYLDVEGDGTIVYTEVATNCYGTGTLVQVRDNMTGQLVEGEEFYIVVFGDINGDGRVSALDFSAVKQETSRVTNWSRGDDTVLYKKLAADVNLDGKITSNDFNIISRHVSSAIAIDQCPDLSGYIF